MFGLKTAMRLLAPYDCWGCGAEGQLVCRDCFNRVVTAPPQHCFKCRKDCDESYICTSCSLDTGLDQVWIGAAYEGQLRRLIRQFKFDRAQDAAQELAQILPNTAHDHTISYIPTATRRVRERGYDHAKLLAEAYAKHQKSSAVALLYRHGQARQVGANRQQRIRQLEHAFAVRNPSLVRQRAILLIDDVITTGATLQSAAHILRQAGARSVAALVLAKKV